MSRRKDVHVPKVWEVEEISDNDDEDIEEMQKEVEDILSKITNKKKISNVSQATPLHFDIKVEVEEYDEQSTVQSNQNLRKPSPSTSKNQLTDNTKTANRNSICNEKITQNQTKIRMPNEKPVEQSLLIQTPTGVPPESNLNAHESQSTSPQPSQIDNLGSNPKIILKHNTYLKCKSYSPTSEFIEQNKLTNPSYQQFELKTDEIEAAMQHLSKYGNLADNYIYLLLRNYYNTPTAPFRSDLEVALQKVLAVWNDWFLKDTENRGPPLLYKCKICGWAWWYLHSFREHLKNVHKGELSLLRFEFEATNGESYIAMKIIRFKHASEVRIVNAPCWRCGMLPGVKYKSFDTTTLSYHCKCGDKFVTCYEYRLHLDMCAEESLTKKLVHYKCYLCFLRFDTPVELQNHRLLSHTVRSDIPTPWLSSRQCKRCLAPYYNGVHDCPTVKRLVSCSYCTKKFSNQTIMKLHQSFSKENVKCRLCNFILQRQCTEWLHLVEHTDNYILLQKCTICEDTMCRYFYNDHAYNIHLLGKHPLSEQSAMKVPVPVKCLQDSGYNVKIPATDKIIMPQPIKDEPSNHYGWMPVEGTQYEFLTVRTGGPRRGRPKKVKRGRPKTSDKSRKEQLSEASARYRRKNPRAIREAAKRYRQKNPQKYREAKKRYTQKNPHVHREAVKHYNKKNPHVNREASRKYYEKQKSLRSCADGIKIENDEKSNNCDSLKRKAAQEESPPKRRKTIVDIIDNKNTTTTKVKDQSIEEFINTENEINEMILLKNKDNNTVVKIKFENFGEGDIRAEENIVNNKIHSNVNCIKNKLITAKNSENDNRAKHENCLPSKNEIKENKDSNTVVKINIENIEADNIRTRENELNIASQKTYLNIHCKKKNPTTTKISKKENCVNNKMCLPTNNDKKITKRNVNDILQTSANCIIYEKENLDTKLSKEVANTEADNEERLDYELHIEKNIINSDVTCNETNQMITNITETCKIDDNCKAKGNNTSNKPIYSHEPHEKNNVTSKASEKEIHNRNVFKNVPINKEDDTPLKENKCLVNQKELNVKITEKVLGNKEINDSEEKDSLYDKEIPNVTSANYNVPKKENHNSKQIDNPGLSTKTLKVEQDNFIKINRNTAIKEEILDDDTDEEKLVIAEFNDLIRDKSVQLEVKEEPEECFEDDMIVWDSSLHDDTDINEDVNVEIGNQGSSSDFLVWSPHLGVVGGDINVEIENRDSYDDDDDLPLLDRKKGKKRFYICKRCKFKGNHRDYIEHKKSCVRINKCEKKFNPMKCDSYKCTMCATKYPTLNKYLKHLTAHSYKPLQCPECLSISPTKAKLLPHVVYHINKHYVPIRGILSATKSGMFKMQCTKCPAEVQTQAFFFHWEQHLAAQRQESDKPNKLEEFAPESPILRELIELLLERCSPDQLTKQKKLRWCKMCNRPFARHNECKRHYIEHLLDDAFAHITETQGLRCQICGDVWQKPGDFRLHIRGHAVMPVYRCELCGKTFSDSSNFAKHRKVHNLCAYTCDTCRKKFNRKRSLIDHVKFHEKQKPISCSVAGCAKVFYSPTAHNKHCKVTHGPVRFPCPICKEKHDSVKDMWDHKWQVHKIRKIIADCPLCDMQFRKYADVKTHLRTAHDSTVDLKRLNTLSPGERSHNVAQLAHDVVVIHEPETEDMVPFSPSRSGRVNWLGNLNM